MDYVWLDTQERTCGSAEDCHYMAQHGQRTVHATTTRMATTGGQTTRTLSLPIWRNCCDTKHCPKSPPSSPHTIDSFVLDIQIQIQKRHSGDTRPPIDWPIVFPWAMPREVILFWNGTVHLQEKYQPLNTSISVAKLTTIPPSSFPSKTTQPWMDTIYTPRAMAASALICGASTPTRIGAAMPVLEGGPKSTRNVPSRDSSRFPLEWPTIHPMSLDSACKSTWEKPRLEDTFTHGIHKVGPCTCLK